jgi:curved DNA-binding protein CbpA
MDSPIPPDPYNALGLSKNATGDEIRKAYRKLALQLHPDKCKEESLKAQRTDEFHLVQQAYDIIGDEEKRGRYDAQIRLAELKRANLELRSQTSRATAGYDVRTAAPRDASYATRGSARAPYEEPRRERAYEYEAGPRPTTSRKASAYDEYLSPRREPVSRDRETERLRAKTQEQEAEVRRKKEKRRDAEVRESRSTKYDSRDIYTEEPRKSEPRSTRPAMRREEVYVGAESTSPTHRKMEDREAAALRHMQERERASARPASYGRTTSSREVPRDYEVRRSAAPAKERVRESTRRDTPVKDDHRRSAEESYDRTAPALKSHSSAPPIVEPSRQAPHRSYTTQSNFDEARAARDESPPSFSRASTMPAPPRRKDSTAPSSKLRHGETILPDPGYSSPVGTPPYTTSKSYTHAPYEEKLSTSPPRPFKTVIAEPKASPSSRRTRSPSPVRPSASNTAAKMANLDPKRYAPTASTRKVYAYGESATPTARPSMPSTTNSTRDVPMVDRSNRRSERDRGRASDREREPRYSYDENHREKLYGEQGPGAPRGYNQPTSFAPEAVSFAKHYDLDDVSFGASRSRDKVRGDSDDFVKPRMIRTQTYAY